MRNKHKAVGHYRVEVVDDGVVIATRELTNLMTTEGVNNLWDVMFGGATQTDPWYIGLIDSVPTPSLQVSDTLASTPGWDELVPGTDYTGNRQAWVEAASNARVKTSSANATFNMLTVKTIYGLFLASAATGTTGILYSVGALDTPLPVVTGNDVNIVYSIEMAV